jgi:hypothetical protein
MPYFYTKSEVPKKVTWSLHGFNFLMVVSQTLSSILCFWMVQKSNNFYFQAYNTPGFNPLTYDYSQGDEYMSKEQFWLNVLVTTQFISGMVLLISILQIRRIVN